MKDKKEYRVRVCIVEDNYELAEFWRNVIDNCNDMVCTGVYSSAEKAEKEIRKNVPDIILMDIGLPKKNGIILTKELKEIYPKLEILICTVFNETDKIVAALQSGASGYLLKSVSGNELIQAIKTIFGGGSPIDTQIARKIITQFQPKKKYGLIDPLTSREEEVLNYIAKGYRNQEIADLFSVSINTIRTHVRNIYSKLQVNSRTKAVRTYLDKIE